MEDYEVLPDGRKVYSLAGVKSRQTGNNAEITLIVGGKGLGKTFQVRKDAISSFLDTGARFVEVSRSGEESKSVQRGYFEKIQREGYFPGYDFKVENDCGYIAERSDNPSWLQLCYFVALSSFQREKRRTYADVDYIIFDEFIIDKRDRYHQIGRASCRERVC